MLGNGDDPGRASRERGSRERGSRERRVIDLREPPAGTCQLCGSPAATIAAFIEHLKDVHGLTDDPGEKSSVVAQLFAPTPSAPEPPPEPAWSSPVYDRVALVARPERTRPARTARAEPVPVVRTSIPGPNRSVPAVRQVAQSSWLWLALFAAAVVIAIVGVVVVVVG